MEYTYKNLTFNDKANPQENTHVVTLHGVRTEQLGFQVNGKGDEGPLTSAWGETQDGKKVSFYVSEEAAKTLEEGGTYEVALSSNRKEPWDYQEPDAERRVFGMSDDIKLIP
jgi:hypothetical protein